MVAAGKRMNSRQQAHEVHLRGLAVPGTRQAVEAPDVVEPWIAKSGMMPEFIRRVPGPCRGRECSDPAPILHRRFQAKTCRKGTSSRHPDGVAVAGTLPCSRRTMQGARTPSEPETCTTKPLTGGSP